MDGPISLLLYRQPPEGGAFHLLPGFKRLLEARRVRHRGRQPRVPAQPMGAVRLSRRALRPGVLPHPQRGGGGSKWMVSVGPSASSGVLTLPDKLRLLLTRDDRDGKSGKPWVDAGTNAQWEFYGDAASWLPTWGEGASRGMTVRSVKMWQDGACK
jgi:hypothetical protein